MIATIISDLLRALGVTRQLLEALTKQADYLSNNYTVDNIVSLQFWRCSCFVRTMIAYIRIVAFIALGMYKQ